MKALFYFPLLIISLLVTGCATTPQGPVDLGQTFWSAPSKKVGVIMTAVPKPDVQLPGAGCLLCMAAAKVANSSITTHFDSVTDDNLANLKDQVVQSLKDKGVDAEVLNQPLDLATLPNNDSKLPNSATKDFSQFKNSNGITHLVVINVTAIGVQRSYSSYVPTSDPQGSFIGTSYMVNLANNTYDWYRPINILKGVSDQWDEPPAFPALTNAYYQALETGRDTVLTPFKK